VPQVSIPTTRVTVIVDRRCIGFAAERFSGIGGPKRAAHSRQKRNQPLAAAEKQLSTFGADPHPGFRATALRPSVEERLVAARAQLARLVDGEFFGFAVTVPNADKTSRAAKHGIQLGRLFVHARRRCLPTVGANIHMKHYRPSIQRIAGHASAIPKRKPGLSLDTIPKRRHISRVASDQQAPKPRAKPPIMPP
jgi:hypothetical protein